jgi:DNA invertase Pin-like site-specific DNA recombinase
MTRRVAIYARVSTNKDQTVENQTMYLTEWCEGRHHTLVAVYTDQGISGAKGRDKRPGLDAMLRDALLGKFDMVAVTDISRLGRSMQHLIEIVRDLDALRVDLFIRDQAIDTSTPAGQLFFHISGAFAEYQRALIREQTKLGLDRARRKGKRLGRPPVSNHKEQKIAALLKAGTPICRIRRIAQVGLSAIYRIKGEIAECPPPTN